MVSPLALECHNLTKAFDGQAVVQQASLNVQAGQLVALLGPSGCGKTTTLRLIAGFEWPDDGTISINGRLVAGQNAHIPAEQRRVGMVFQEYALFPHLDVAGNIGFGLQGSTGDHARRVGEMLELVGLVGLGKRMPFELSGGQQQRVALARALAPQPEVLLLDEPFSNLDAALRMQVRGEVRAILKEAGITGVFVTHDQEEALSLADEVAVMMHGRVVQSAPPEVLYSHPATRDVAAFVGEANFLRGQAEGDSVQCVLGSFPLVAPAEGAVFILLRPENVHLSAADGTGNASVIWREFYGHDQRVGLRLSDNTRLVARLDSLQTFDVGQPLQVEIIGEVRAFPL